MARFLGNNTPQLWIPRRRSVALGAAIGAVVSIVPLPAQTLIAALLAVRFKAHLPTAVVVTFLSNPLTALPLWGLAWMLGALCLGHPVGWPALSFSTSGAEWLSWLQGTGRPLLLGMPLLAALLGIAFFGLTHMGWRLAVVRQWHGRRAARVLSEGPLRPN
ncbi:DUF2062 domain-containing protein [Actimicrobium antarcticum]|uniref:DUF2062 domain-containing protein n=1 Tax=Actimicrobium antarcticum TaxID=1051899 RepID=A0ABP7ST47_9BURK